MTASLRTRRALSLLALAGVLIVTVFASVATSVHEVDHGPAVERVGTYGVPR